MRVIGNWRSHDRLRDYLRTMRPARVLDAPTGEGVLAKFLVENGWDVTCADIDPCMFRLDGIPFKRTDLNRPLPFPDQSFDVVVCANGIHRLYNPGGAIAEFFRILRPGGRLLLNTNNYASIYHRLRFLLYGSLDNYVNSQFAGQSVDDPEAHIRISIMLPQVLSSMEKAGFAIGVIKPTAIQVRQWVLAPLALIIFMFARLLPQAKHNYVSSTSSIATMFGHYLLIEALKPQQ